MRQLPVFSALFHALKSTTDNLGFAFHISWPWIVLLLPINIITTLYMLFNGLQIAPGTNPDPALVAKVFIVSTPLFIVSLISYSSIAVNWHRYVLLDEVPQGWARFRIDELTWRYIGNALLIALIVAGAFLLVSIVITLITAALVMLLGQAIGIIFYTACVIALVTYGIIAFYRMGIKLPAVALGRNDYKMKNAWADSAGNEWRILGLVGLMVAMMLIAGLLLFLSALIFTNFGVIGLSISIAIQVMVNWVATIFGVTLLTSLYGFFVENRDF